MSLIQDALKRKSEEKAAASTSEPVYGGAPSGAFIETETKNPRPLLIVLIILLIALVLAALSGLAFYLIRMPAPAPQAEKAPVTENSPAVASEDTAALPASPAVDVPESLPPPRPPVADAPVTGIPAPEIRTPWPELKLTGIASSGSQRIAIINGKMLTTGRTIGDAVVREIHETRAVVEFHGERRILHVDE